MKQSNRQKLVFVVSRFPYPLEKGDKLRSYYQIKELSKQYEIHLIALSDTKISTSSKEELKKYCRSISIFYISRFSILINCFIALLGKKPIQVGYFYNPLIHIKVSKLLQSIRPDYIISQLIRTTDYTKNYHHCPKTLDYMDALSKGMERRIQNAPFYKKWFFSTEYQRLKNYERIMFDYFEHKTIISEQDKKYIFHPERKNIQCVPNGIDSYFFEQLNIEKKYDISFVGNMNYPPNIEAVSYIVQYILPHFPKIKFLVAGANPHPKLEKLAKNNPQITIAGWIDDIRTAYLSSSIFLAPMQTGTGMQNKLLEAMALGIPCITSSLANNAIKATHNKEIIVNDEVNEIIASIQFLLENESIGKQIGEEGRKFVEINYSWEETTINMIQHKTF